ncbi:MAG: nucleoside deaminase [Bacillota bacterium]|jgi:guanine deaminase
MNKYMQLAKEEALKGMASNAGGPFGACIVKDGRVLAVAHNEVLSSLDPTAHAEIVAIRKAAKFLHMYDLSGAEIYATGYPCPMCLAAIIWSNIKTCYFSNSLDAAEKIGFRDDAIYRHLAGKEKALEIICLDEGACLDLYEKYQSDNRTIY